MSDRSAGSNAALATRPTNANIEALSRAEQVLIGGDLAQLSPRERLQYYEGLCESFGLNKLSQPFQYLELQGKLTLYATKACASQLREQRHISIYKLEREIEDDLYIVRAYARTPDGREDVDEGSVPLLKEGGEWKTSQNGKRYFQGNGVFALLQGEELVNARLKAVTKAKRRVTLSICGMGFLDETEVESIRQARRVSVDHSTGEIMDEASKALPEKASVPVDDLGLTSRFTAAWAALNEEFGWENKRLNAEYRLSIGKLMRFDNLTVPERNKAVEHLEALVEGERAAAQSALDGSVQDGEGESDPNDIPFAKRWEYEEMFQVRPGKTAFRVLSPFSNA